MPIQAIATVRGPGLVYETPTLIRGGACTEVSLRGGVAHAYGYTIGYTMGSPKAPYWLRKRRIFYVRKRIPKELIGFYGRAFFQRSLR